LKDKIITAESYMVIARLLFFSKKIIIKFLIPLAIGLLFLFVFN
jgi:hypothetical protein